MTIAVKMSGSATVRQLLRNESSAIPSLSEDLSQEPTRTARTRVAQPPGIGPNALQVRRKRPLPRDS